MDDCCGGAGRAATGVTLWEGAYFLAEWLSRQDRRRPPTVPAALFANAADDAGESLEDCAAGLRSWTD